MSSTGRPRRADHRAAAARRPQPQVVRRSPIHGRYAPPDAERLTRNRRTQPGGALPSAARAVLLVAVIALAGSVALVATGAIGSAVGGLGSSLGSLVDGLVGTSPTPSASSILAPDAAPRLQKPDDPYTTTEAWDLRGILPSGAAGSSDLRLRIYVNDEQVDEVPVPATTDFVVPAVPLLEGENDISVAVVAPEGEGPRSEAITIILDTEAPPLTITAPKDKLRAKTTVQTVVVTGTTQPAAIVAVRNANTGGSASVSARKDGAFKVEIGIGDGTNQLVVTATDPAGNETVKTVTVLRGTGKLTAKVAVYPVRVKRAALPERLTITVTVTDVGGKRISGAEVAFSLSPPGQPTSTFTATTVDGVATWRMTLPKAGTEVGPGFVTALVTLKDGRTITASNAFSVY